MREAVATELITRRAPADTHGVGPRHANGWFELSFVEVGTLEFRMDRERLELATGDVGVLAPWLANTPTAHGLTVHQLWLSPDRLAEAAAAMDHRAHADAMLRFAPASRVAAIARALVLGSRRDPIHTPAQAALVDALALALFDPDDRAPRAASPSTIRRAIERITTDYASPLTIEQLATDADVTRFALHRAFVATTGQSPYRYLTAHRLERAAHLLRTSRASILEIALSCGFTDPGRFARAFRARFGVTPRSYRASAAT